MAENEQGITAITVGGYKSIRDETTIEIRPLTILAGANSSGKSSIMQPMLLMKQTLDASYDPGPLLLDGPHVRFTKCEQFAPKMNGEGQQFLTVGFEYNKDEVLSCEFTFPKEKKSQKSLIELSRMTAASSGEDYELSPGMSEEEIISKIPEELLKFVEELNSDRDEEFDWGWEVRASGCFLHIGMFEKTRGNQFPILPVDPVPEVRSSIVNLIHLPGLRGNPERIYPTTSSQGPRFRGHFQHYTAGLLSDWKDEESKQVSWVEWGLSALELTSWVDAAPLDDVNVEIRVGRLLKSPKIKDDGVNIADVGFGVSQVLPVLVALAAAETGQMVYIEQPELHLHPRAQVALASVLADAAKRGVRVVIETHSSLLLQAVMTLIAEEKLSHEEVILHWFSRDDEGYTNIKPAVPDENGAYGEWPEDFADVELGIQKQHLDAVAEREFAT